MTKIRYYPDEYRVTINGHAGFDKAGEDIVCAGISTLAYTLINAATDDPAYMAHVYMNGDPAEIQVQCYPDDDHKDLCSEMFRTIMHGYETIRESYPEYITITGGYDG